MSFNIIRAAVVGVSVAILLATASARAAAPLMLVGPSPDVSVQQATFSPDGTQVLYYADDEAPFEFNLYKVSPDGGFSYSLSGPMISGGGASVTDYVFSADGRNVLYYAQQETIGTTDLYTVPIASGGPTKVNAPLIPNGNVSFYRSVYSHNGLYVTYAADQETDNTEELYVFNREGGPAIKLSGMTPPGPSSLPSDPVRFSPDDNSVLFAAALETLDLPELYITPTSGGTPLKLSGTFPMGAEGVVNRSGTFVLGGSHVLYVADQETAEIPELFVVPSSGGTPVKLNGPMQPNGRIRDKIFITPDGNHVLYRGDQDTDGKDELYITPVLGGPIIKLNPTLAPGGDVDDVILFSPDGTKVAFLAEVSGTSTSDLYITSLTGGTPLKLSPPMVSGGDVTDSETATMFTHDGSRVLYAADAEVEDQREFYSVPSTGGASTKLNQALAADERVATDAVRQSPDGKRVTFGVENESTETNELFIVPVEGGAPVKVSAPVGMGERVTDPQFNADGTRILYSLEGQSGIQSIFSRVVKERVVAAGGQWNNGATWHLGQEPDEVMHVVIDRPTTTTVDSFSFGAANMIDLGGGTGTSTLQLEYGSTLSSANRIAIHNKGVLRGTGQIIADVVVEAGGEVRAGAGARLLFNGNSFSNAGRVEAIGNAANQAEIEFSAPVSNAVSTGLITGSHARLRFNSGLTNAGSLALSVGESHVFGDIDNTGKIVITGGGAVTFYDDVVQNGVLTISKVGNVSSTAVFLGSISGSGTMGGGGDVFVEGDLRPGNSPGTISFANNIYLGTGTNVDIEIGGMSAGTQYDRINVTGQLALNGSLNAALVDIGSGVFLPEGGSAFQIITATQGISGSFDTVSLPESRGGISWSSQFGSNAVTLQTSGVLGDYNFDGTVDAADYVVWRKSFGSGNAAADGSGNGLVDNNDLTVWRSHFGQTASGSGSGSLTELANVPEPACFALLMLGGLFMAGQSRRRKPALIC